MKRIITSFVLSILCWTLQAQLSDRLWLGGYNEFPGVPGNGNFSLWFDENGPKVQQTPLAFNFESTMAVAAAPNGQILFYSNGCEVANRLHQVMPNGGGLNPGDIGEQVCPWKGYIVPQGAMALPMPGDSTRFMLLHIGATYEPERKLRLGPLYYSTIDMSLENGLGDVATKNNVLLNEDLGNFNVIRHGNGRDWWIVAPAFDNLKWYVFLLSPQGIQPMPPQTVSMGGLRCEHHGQTAVSPDGSRLASWGDCKMTVFNFDRCSGTFGTVLELAVLPRHWFAGGGAAFSPSGRYLYATDHNVLLRADLEASMPQLDTMRFSYGAGNYTVPGNTFHYLVNGPYDILYGNFPSRAKYFHALKNPEGAGINDINFVPQSVALPVTNVRTLPHFPNFRLYDLQGSPCDTLGIDGSSVSTQAPTSSPFMRLSPNPTGEVLYVQLQGNTGFSPTNTSNVWIMDATGRVMIQQEVIFKDHGVPIDVRLLPPGLYYFSLRAGGKVWGGKFVKL